MYQHRTAIARLPRLIAVFAFLVLASCGGDSGPAVVDNDTNFIPNFTFVWDEVDASGAFVSPTHRFALLVDQEGQKSGSFNSSSNEQLNGETNSLTGTYMNKNVTVTVNRGGTQVGISGLFLDDNTIQFREPTRTYNIKRNENP
jgi:hypothetical protein